MANKTKYVYFFGGGKAEGRTQMKNLLGGKGANLAEMSNLGLPVPSGFTITTEACEQFYKQGRKWPKGFGWGSRFTFQPSLCSVLPFIGRRGSFV